MLHVADVFIIYRDASDAGAPKRACVITRAQLPIIDILTPNMLHIVIPMSVMS